MFTCENRKIILYYIEKLNQQNDTIYINNFNLRKENHEMQATINSLIHYKGSVCNFVTKFQQLNIEQYEKLTLNIKH